MNYDFNISCENEYGSKDLGHATETRRKWHDCLEMILGILTKKALLVDMTDYGDQVMECFPGALAKGTKAWLSIFSS